VNRRGFLTGLFAAAAVRTFPFRVYSFPSSLVAPDLYERLDKAIKENWMVARGGTVTFGTSRFEQHGPYMVAQLERLDAQIRQPLEAVTWTKDIDLRHVDARTVRAVLKVMDEKEPS
jgi:hypothetical protein